MYNAKLGWVNEVEGRVKRAKSAHDDATARRKRAEATLDTLQATLKSLQEILKNAQEEAKVAKLKEEEAFQELNKAAAIQQAVEANHGVVTLDNDEDDEDDWKRRDGDDKKRAVTPTQLENSPRKTPRLDADISSITSIEVTGCGDTRVNGKYLKKRVRNGHPMFVHERGWQERHCFALMYFRFSRCWAIADYQNTSQFDPERESGDLCQRLYERQATDPIDEKLFHEGWSVTPMGVDPPPQINFLT